MAGFNPFLFGNPTGVGQQTAVGQALVMRASGTATRRRSKKKRSVRGIAPRKRKPMRSGRASRARGARRKPARLVKGSAAAKRYMASIRRKRR